MKGLDIIPIPEAIDLPIPLISTTIALYNKNNCSVIFSFSLEVLIPRVGPTLINIVIESNINTCAKL